MKKLLLITITRLSVLLVMFAFAVSAKAFKAQPTYMDGEIGYTILLESNQDKLDAGPAEKATYQDPTINPSNCVQGVYQDETTGDLFLRYQNAGGIPGDIYLSEITKIRLRTADGVTLDGGKLNQLKNNYPNLAYLDFENASVNNNAWGNLNSMSQLRTLIFPKANGLLISKQAFQGNQSLETVIFPDNNGTYEIMENAFRNAKIKTLSMGRGYTISDMAQSGGIWKSASGSGLGIFEHCSQLKNVVLDNSIKNLGEKAFTATFALEYIVLPEELEHMGPLCFKESALRTVTIPDHCVLTGSTSPQIFQGCVWLRNIFVNADNIPCDMQGVMEMGQTSNFKWNPEVDQSKPTYSVNDYVGSGNEAWHSTYGDECPFNNQTYTVPVFHYPGTVTAIENYRVPKYLHYSNVDPETGTTWPKASEINIYNSITEDGVTYRGFDYNTEANSGFGGWRQFPLGSNTFKEQKVFYDERIKESRWYSICLPINMTEAQFMNAYGVGAALHEFSGAVYEPDKGAIILQFNTPATAGSDGILLKKNVPYMIHPAKIKFTQRKEIKTVDGGGVEFVTEEGQADYATTPVIATFDVESDLFVKWDVIMTGTDPMNPDVTLASTINTIKNNTASALTAAAVTKSLDASKAPEGQKPLPADFTFKGSYLGAKLYAPEGKNIYVGESPNLPVGAYYLGYDPNTMTQPKFFKAKGTATWIPYGALIEKTGASASGAGAKVFETLDLDFNDLSDYMVETGIGAPTIQIPVVNTDSKIYNLNGQVVRENSKDTNGLKGIYIVGGKKVIFN